MKIKSYIRTIPNYPKPGIMFRDITTLIKDPSGFKLTIDSFLDRYKSMKIDKVVGIEARGFIFGAALASQIEVGFVPIRKKGKLPAETFVADYSLEYGIDSIEIHTDAIKHGENVLLVDDLIATGGTAQAAAELILSMGANLVECAFVIDLPSLNGRKKLEELGYKVFTLVEFEED
jgi:adenine phosphoribosyltransferase